MFYKDKELTGGAAQAVDAALTSGRFPHTCVIEGGTPSARMELAQAAAARLVCSNGKAGICGVCPHCKKALNGSHPDIEICSENSKGNLDMETTRRIINSSMIVPNEADTKIYIIDTNNPIQLPSQNALLKLLEEPPKYAFYMILCPSKASLLPTVLSRAQVFSLGEARNNEQSKLWSAALEMARGVALAAAAPGEFAIFEAAAGFEKNRELLKISLEILEEIFVEAMKIKCGAASCDDPEAPEKVLASKMTLKRLTLLGDRTRELQAALNHNGNFNLILLRLCSLLRAD